MSTRQKRAYEMRQNTAAFYRELSPAPQRANSDEQRLPNFAGSFSKGLQHQSLAQFGEVEPDIFPQFTAALWNGSPSVFAAVPIATPFNPSVPDSRLVNPQAGIAFDTQGADCAMLTMPPAPAFHSAEAEAEIAENYWMALCRDIKFADYVTSPIVKDAAKDLTKFKAFGGPRDVAGKVTPQTIFRGGFPGDSAGDYLSVFMTRPIPYGAQRIEPLIAYSLPAGQDFLMDEAEWLGVQNGGPGQPVKISAVVPPRPIETGRDLAQYVHIDELFQAYLNACLILITPAGRGGLFPGNNIPISSQLPYNFASGSPTSKNQTGFGTLGEPNFKTMVCEVATRALKAVWHQKWFVHRRQRPEAFAGCIHFAQTDPAAAARYGLNLAPLSSVLAAVNAYNTGKGSNTFLLPMAFPEGSPKHPAYGAGHATVAGACVTVLKALFDTKALIPGSPTMTVGGELDKLAANVGMARNFAGVHWRSDYTQSARLGEQVALFFLQETVRTYNEDFSLTVPLFDGRTVTISKVDDLTTQGYDFRTLYPDVYTL